MFAIYVVTNMMRLSVMSTTALLPEPSGKISPQILNAPFAALEKTSFPSSNINLISH